jgi:hypothetical protein
MPGYFSDPKFGSTQDSLRDMESALSLLKAETINFGYRYINDSEVRGSYIRQSEFLAKTIRWELECGRLSPQEAAMDANQIRNAIMDAHRIDSSDVGRSKAEQLKRHGKPLWVLEEEKADMLFGRKFDSLSQIEKNRVWLEIVDSSGRPRPAVNAMNVRIARVGRALLFASVAISVYNIATADDTGRQIAKEGVSAGAGVLGGMAGGALAGIACGPASPICVTIGVFVGGAMAALGADAGFDWVW